MHELAQVEVDPTGPDVEFFQEHKTALSLTRCPSCDGLRGITNRNRETAALCKDCRSGKVIPRSAFFGFWLEIFTDEEIEEMADAIWG